MPRPYSLRYCLASSLFVTPYDLRLVAPFVFYCIIICVPLFSAHAKSSFKCEHSPLMLNLTEIRSYMLP